jgi:S1-C subfamily serine protease
MHSQVRRFALVATFCLTAWASLALAADPASPAYLGIFFQPAEGATQTGVVVGQVVPDSPASKAGLKEADVITKVDDQEIKDPEKLTSTIANHKPGDKVTLHILRDGKEQSLDVTLGERPRATARSLEPAPEGRERRALLGVQTQELTPDLKKRLGIAADQGALITDVGRGTPAEKAGLRTNDVITAVDNTPVANLEELRAAVQKAGPGKEVTLTVARGKETLTLKAKLEETAAGGFPPRGPLPGFPDARFPPGGRFPEFPPVFEESRRVQELEKRVQELEKRVRELEQKQSPK